MHSSMRISALICFVVLLVSAPLFLAPTSQAMFSITIYFGQRPSCTGRGFCKIEIGFERDAAGGKNSGQASATVEQDKTARNASHRFLKIEMRNALPGKWAVVPISENMALDAATSKALGFKSVTVLKGDYKVDYTKNKMGTVNLQIEAHD